MLIQIPNRNSEGLSVSRQMKNVNVWEHLWIQSRLDLAADPGHSQGSADPLTSTAAHLLWMTHLFFKQHNCLTCKNRLHIMSVMDESAGQR